MDKIFALPYRRNASDERLTETLRRWKSSSAFASYYFSEMWLRAGESTMSRVAVLKAPVASEAHAALLRRLVAKRRSEGEVGNAAYGKHDVVFALYSDVQSIATRFPGAVFAPPPDQGQAGAHETGLNVGKGGESNQGDDTGGDGDHGHRRGGTAAYQVWVPMPTPKRSHLQRAKRLLNLLHEEVVESARESVARRWNHERLAVRGEMGQLAPARVWERLGVPRLMLAVDNSGSMGGFVDQVMALGAALSEAMPWLLVIAAPNGHPAPLFLAEDGHGEVHAILDGKPWRPDAPIAYQDGVYQYKTSWPEIARKANVAGVIYVGDWEDDFVVELENVPRRGVVSVYESSWRPVTLTDRNFGVRRPFPVVIGCGSTDEFLSALELILGAWRSSGQ